MNALISNYKTKVARQGIDEQAIDWTSISKDTDEDGIRQYLYDEYAITFTETPKEAMQRIKNEIEQQEQKEETEITRKEAETEKLQQEQMRQARKEGNFLNEKFATLKKYVQTFQSNPSIHLLIISGEAGLGKTYTVTASLKKPLLLSNKITPFELYNTMLQNQESTIILDDINWQELTPQIMTATNTTRKRFIHYHTSRTRTPKTAEYTGKIAIITNTPKNKIPSPLLSRAYYYEMQLNYPEKIILLYELAKTMNIPAEVPKYVEENATPATENLDFRKIIKINEIRKHNPTDWKTLSLNELQEDTELKIIMELQTENTNTANQITEWTLRTGKSRSTYFNLKQKLKLRG